jgi:hypothetical protein
MYDVTKPEQNPKSDIAGTDQKSKVITLPQTNPASNSQPQIFTDSIPAFDDLFVTEADLQKLTKTMVKPEVIFLSRFEHEVYAIQRSGNALREAISHRESITNATAAAGLAAILALYYKYFHGKPATQTVVLVESLRKTAKMKGKNSKTTEFHLLSRIYRGSDDQQAASDAKILWRAVENKPEPIKFEDFQNWVKEQGGLKKIKNDYTAEQKAENKLKAEQKKAEADKIAAEKLAKQKRDANDPKIMNQRAIDAMVAASKVSKAKHIFDFEPDDAPADLKKMFSDGAKAVSLMVKIEDGDFVFYALTDTVFEDSPAPSAATQSPKASAEEQTDDSTAEAEA